MCMMRRHAFLVYCRKFLELSVCIKEFLVLSACILYCLSKNFLYCQRVSCFVRTQNRDLTIIWELSIIWCEISNLNLMQDDSTINWIWLCKTACVMVYPLNLGQFRGKISFSTLFYNWIWSKLTSEYQEKYIKKILPPHY